MFKRVIKIWHLFLGISVASIIFCIFLYLGLNPLKFSEIIGSRFSSAFNSSTSATVRENPFNKLAYQLQEKENRLNQREGGLDEREKNINEASKLQNNPLIIFLIFGMTGIFILTFLNFYLDNKRKKRIKKIEIEEEQLEEKINKY